jgi:hypothetical protein
MAESNEAQSAISRLVFIDELFTKIFRNLLEPENVREHGDPAIDVHNLLVALTTCKSTYNACVNYSMGRKMCFLVADLSNGLPQLNHFLFQHVSQVRGYHLLDPHFSQQLALLILVELGKLPKEGPHHKSTG